MDRSTPEFMTDAMAVRVNRRTFLRRTALSAAGLSAIGLLAACGGGTAPTATGGATTPSAAGASTLPTRAAASSSVPTSAASAAAASSATTAPVARQGGELTYALATKFDSLDPNVTTFTVVGRMGFHLFDQLVREPKPNEFIPGLAQKWEVNATADEYTFHLRTDVTFHDGTPFNADAVKFTFDRIVDPNLKSQLALSSIGPYASTTVGDPATVTVKFKTPYAPFLDSASQPFLCPVSPAAVQKFGKDFGTNPVGTGPFKFDSYKTDNVVRMVKNPDYKWAPTMFKHQGAPYLDAINWRIINEPSTRLAALQSGEIQVMEDVATQDYKNVQSNTTFQILQGVIAGSGWSAMINVTKMPSDDVKVRQALEWGADKAGMIKAVWKDLFKPASSPLTSITFGYDPATANVYSYDPKKAGALLDDAGWKMGSSGVRQKDGKDLVLGVYYRSDNADFAGMATFCEASYQQIGVKLDLHGLAQAGYFDAVRQGQHHIQFWWGPGTDPDILRQFYHSSNADGGTNRNRYKHADMDKLINDAAGTTDPEKRKQLYAQIQKKVLDEAIMVFFSDPLNIFAYQKAKVSDLALDWSATYPLFYDTTLAK
jgi:peptide/nickel transport system substrate-binding protein